MGDLVYTGERAIPGLTPECTMVAHLARYRLAQGLATHKRVLDACCGVGYGTALMAETAREAVGFDVDEEAIAYARENYTNPLGGIELKPEAAAYAHEHFASQRTRFEQCDIRDWQERDFDLVVAFEALEHVYECAAFVEALYRSLRARGMVIVSIPTLSNCRQGPFHVRCYQREEFEGLMGEWFRGWIWGQRLTKIDADVEDPDYWVYVGRRL